MTKSLLEDASKATEQQTNLACESLESSPQCTFFNVLQVVPVMQ